MFLSTLGLNITDGNSWLNIFSYCLVFIRTDPTDPTWIGMFQKGMGKC